MREACGSNISRVVALWTDRLPTQRRHCARIVDSGALDGQRVELLDGIIIEMSPQSPQHSSRWGGLPDCATMTRRFSGGARIALFLAAGGRCAECGAALGPGWHADHLTPVRANGETHPANGRALCPRCNLRKGGRVQ